MNRLTASGSSAAGHVGRSSWASVRVASAPAIATRFRASDRVRGAAVEVLAGLEADPRPRRASTWCGSSPGCAEVAAARARRPPMAPRRSGSVRGRFTARGRSCSPLESPAGLTEVHRRCLPADGAEGSPPALRTIHGQCADCARRWGNDVAGIACVRFVRRSGCRYDCKRQHTQTTSYESAFRSAAGATSIRRSRPTADRPSPVDVITEDAMLTATHVARAVSVSRRA